MNTHIVLGLNYGDEGKGRVVDSLCSSPYINNPIVVRFSGGQQCGHTVINNNGKHVHSTFPSGTLRGCDGYISEHCTFSPTYFLNEVDVLERILLSAKVDNKLVYFPKLYIHPLTKITTPWDVKLNRDNELKNNHGSCGMGVGETMRRHLETPYKLHAIDLFNERLLRTKLELFSNALGDIPLNDFIDDCNQSAKILRLASYDILKNRNIIFEGSQGILLDMDHGFFPHVTYANTTAKNAVDICNKIGRQMTNRHYVTRSYMTRHGNGPFHTECELELVNTEEEINVENQWQGKFRVGKLDYELLQYAYTVDSLYYPFGEDIPKTLHVTCMDQVSSIQIDDMGHKFMRHFDVDSDDIVYYHTPFNT